MRKIIDSYETVKALLEAHPILRDDEVLCWLRVKNNYLKSKGINPKTISSYDVDMMEFRGELPNRSSIERAWRLVLERELHLRTPSWYARHKQEKEVIEDINEVTKLKHAPSNTVIYNQ